MGVCAKEYGETAGQVVGIVALAELGFLANGGPSIREITWTMSLRRYLQLLPDMRATITKLSRDGWMRLPVRMREINYGMPVWPGAHLLRGIDEFIKQDPISRAEIDHCIENIY